jgi:hypothetical protein
MRLRNPVDLIAPRPLLMIVGREAVTSWMSVEVFQNVHGPKELAGSTAP